MSGVTSSMSHMVWCLGPWLLGPVSNDNSEIPHRHSVPPSFLGCPSCPLLQSSNFVSLIIEINVWNFQTKKKSYWPRRDSNTQPSDLESDALPLRHGVKLCEVLPRFELGSLDSKSRVLTITPWDPTCSMSVSKSLETSWLISNSTTVTTYL